VVIDLCAPCKQEAKELEAKITEIQSSPDYIQGPKPGKPDPELLAEVQQLQAQVKKALDQWEACMLQNPANLPTVDATLTGTAKLTIPGLISDSKAVSVGVRFHEFDHKVVEIMSFPTLVIGPFPVPGGTNTTTITQLSSANGTCDRSSGFLQLPIALHFHESNLFAGDSDMFGTLSTDASGGSRIDASGNIAIASAVTFKGGTLDKKTGTLVVTGKLSALP
jgi:hypothetical protein